MSLDNKALLALVKKNPILAACMVVSLGLAAAIYTRSGLADERQAELDQKSSEGKRYHANLANATQLAEELKVVTDANRVVRERSINPADLAKNLQYFYRIEAETGIKFTDLRQMSMGATPARAAAPAPAAAPAGAKPATSAYVPVNYSISLSGDYPKVIAFLRNLEQGAHFCRVNGMTASGTGTNLVLTLNLDLLGQP